PENYILTTELDEVNKITKDSITTVTLNGTNRVNSKLFLNNSKRFNTVETDYFSIVTNIDDNKIQSLDRVLLTDKIASFIANNLGSYPHKRLLISNIDYKKNPIYGLNLLPDFIRPFPDSFQYELKLLKTALRVYLENTLMLNPRKEQWLIDGFQTYFLIKYVEENYPNMSIIGSFANIWGIKSFHAAKLKFNDQYPLMYMNMARDNLDQPLTMQKDSLLKFNKNIANPNKAAVGLRYLNSFDESISMDNAIKEFITLQKLKTTTTKDFKKLVKSKASKNIDWFFSDYLTTNKKIDFTVKKVEEQGDSILVHVKNKRGNSMPSALFLMQEDSVISKTWLHNFKDEKIIKLPKKDATKLVINKDHVTPEFNNRNNTKSLTGSLLNKPFQLRLIKDVEDSRYNQLFIMPIVEYNNIYDGLVLGTKAYNKTALRKDFNYKLSPQYATNSNTITGTGSFVYHQFFNNVRYLNKIQYTLTGSYESYAENLFVRTFKPNITFHLKDTKNLRLNKRQLLNLRFVSINRDKDLNNVLENKSEPNYNIFNLRFINYNPGMLNYSSWFADFQISNTFSKIGFNYEFRKLYQNNRQLNLRFFAGTFIKNKNDANSNYFSFALDRPTDYLFDYDYLGRSESNGLFSQQVIIAEGGFKSKLNKPFANQWMATANVSTSIWQYIHAYGD
ncbi:MAG: metalloprotease, partial [Oceanihabitans sp.]